MASSLRPLIQTIDAASESLCHTVKGDVDDAERSRLLTAISRLQNVLEPVATKLQKLTLGVSLDVVSRYGGRNEVGFSSLTLKHQKELSITGRKNSAWYGRL